MASPPVPHVQWHADARLPRVLAHMWIAVVAIALLGPALLPGFVLSYDLVFTPRQDLLPGFLGVGGGLPRAVPQDAVVALLETVIPGMFVEKVALLAIPLLAGWGMLRLLPSTAAGVVAGTLAAVNPFVVERLVIGHWGLLLAYSLLPWALTIAGRLRTSGEPLDGLRIVLLIAAGSLTASGSLLMTVVVLPVVVLPRSAVTVRGRLVLCAAALATWIPWLLPSLLHPSAGTSDRIGTTVFALRPEGPWGAVLTALGGGGIWNAEVMVPSRATVLALILTSLIVALSVLGWRGLRRNLGGMLVGWWTVAAIAGFIAAVASALITDPWADLLAVTPGGGLLRDAHKLLAPLTLLLAAAAGMGLMSVISRVRERATRGLAIVGVVIVALACQPDALLGAGGRLSAVDYPSDWMSARSTLLADSRPGDVVSFPWTSFRRFPWNQERTVLDPAPRWLPRTTVVADDLLVATTDGTAVVMGDDPRASAVSRAIADSRPMGPTLQGLGIGWALVALGTPGPVPELPGWVPVVDGRELTLYAAPGEVRTVDIDRRALTMVAVADGALLAALLLGLSFLGIRRVLGSGPDRLVPWRVRRLS
jgi:hypothetical protein